METNPTPFAPDLADATRRWEEFEASLGELEPPDERGERSLPRSAIPVANSAVNVQDLHPELLARIADVFRDDRISGKARVSSGVRTYEHQKRLFEQMGPGRAANPDAIRSDGRRGSSHMLQQATFRYAGTFEPGQYGYAADVGFFGEPDWNLLAAVMAENGLRLTVFRPYEPWHFELDPDGSSSPTTFRFEVTGSGVEDMQQRLSTQHEYMPHTIPDPGRIDGKFGPKTEAALAAWQTLVGVDADGAWGPRTEAATAAWLDLRKVIIRPGDSGDAVRNRQRYLADRHAERPGDVSDPGDIDGTYGAKSAASTSGWQAVLDTNVDGKWGPNTWAASDHYDDEQRA